MESGRSINASSQLFNVDRSTLYRWSSLLKTQGNLLAKERTEYRAKKLPEEKVRAYIENHADATLVELATHFSCSCEGIAKACRRLGITRKKRLLYVEKDEVKRQDFLTSLAAMAPAQLIHLDESGFDS